MEVVSDSRIEASFLGRSEKTIRFQNHKNKKTITVSAKDIIGASILRTNGTYKLRKLPGKGYLVEGAL